MAELLATTVEGAQADILDAIAEAMALLDGAEIHLLKAPLVPANNLLLADLLEDEADYTGYAEQVVDTWQAAAKGADGVITVDSNNLQFLASGVLASNTIYGAFLTTPMAGSLIGVAELPAPVVMGVDVLQAVDITWRQSVVQ